MASEKYLYDKMVSHLAFEPTECQKQMFKTLSEFILSDSTKDWMLVVSGYAGTGKTSALAAFITLLKRLRMKYVLLAPTGRSAKVLSNFTGEKARTIHKHIYRQKSLDGHGGSFTLDFNKASDTVYIVDEVSLINIGTDSDSIFGSGDTLEDLVQYVRSNPSNRLILTGDPAQLPPIGLEESPALDIDYLREYCPDVKSVYLRDVVRQAAQSGILVNATALREEIEGGDVSAPHFALKQYKDIQAITGGELIEELSSAIDKYGEEEVVVLCRSNQRANRYNEGIRAQVLYRDERLQKGDRVMIVKNCYQFEGEREDLDFIANGDVATLRKISNYEERYGLEFASARLVFEDYEGAEVTAKIILNTLSSQSAALDRDQQNALFEGVSEDYAHIKTKRKRYEAVREDPYFNALQIKYSMAITGHKSQGGQWKCVFIDNILWRDEITLDDKKWLYTAITRGVDKVFLVNFPKKFLDDE